MDLNEINPSEMFSLDSVRDLNISLTGLLESEHNPIKNSSVGKSWKDYIPIVIVGLVLFVAMRRKL